MHQLELKNKDLKARLDRLEAISIERLVLAAGSKRQGVRRARKEKG
jgi:hypothetical protein